MHNGSLPPPPAPGSSERSSTGKLSGALGRPPWSAAETPRWGMGDVGIGLVAGLVLSTVMGAIWLAIGGTEELSLGGRAFSQVGLWMGLAGSAYLATRLKGN